MDKETFEGFMAIVIIAIVIAFICMLFKTL